MKPLSLEIAGLNSFRRKQVIEFGALLEDGLFGIFGPTGSGKSTILDAITLALYGRVKRAPGGKGGVINVREKSCSVSFTFEVDCDGDRARYRVERVLASGKNDSVQTKRSRLIKFDGETEVPIAEKQSEIDEKILELLGIQYDEFLRAVVLPQGAFSDFLSLKPKDRAGVLQRLFGLQELGHRLATRLKAESDRLKTTRAGIEGRLAELRLYDDSAVAAAEARLAEADVAERAAREALATATATLGSVEELAALLDERASLVARDASRASSESELAELTARLERSVRAHSLLATIDALEHAEQRLGETAAGFDAAVASERDADTRYTVAMARFDEVDRRYRAEHDRLCDEIARLDAAARELDGVSAQKAEAVLAESERDRARSALDSSEALRDALRLQIAASDAAIAEFEARLKSLAVSRDEIDRLTAVQVTTSRYRDRLASLAEQTRTVEEMTAAIAELDALLVELRAADVANGAALLKAQAEHQMTQGVVEERTKERTAIAESFLHLKGVLGKIEELESQCAEHEALCASSRAAIEQTDAQWKVVEHRFHGVSERKKTLEVERLEAQERLQDAYRRHAIATLAPQMRDGEACPLCGSIEHPMPASADSAGHHEIAELEAALRAVEKEYIDATDRFTRCGQDMGTIQTERAHAADALERGTRLLTATRLKIDHELTVAAGENLPLASSDDIRRYLDVILSDGNAVRARLDAAIERVRDLDVRLTELKEIANEHTRRCADLEASRRGRQEQLLDARNAVSKLESEIAELRASIADQAGGRSPEEVECELERLRESDRAAQHLRDVIANEQKKLALDRTELESLDRVVAEQSARHAAADSLVRRIASEIESRSAAIETQVASLRRDGESGLAIAALVDERTTRRDGLVRERTECDAARNEAASEVKVAAASVEHHRRAHARDLADRDANARACDAALAAAGFASAAEAREAALDVIEQSELRARIQAIEEELRLLVTRLEENARMIDGRALGDDELDRARAVHAEATRAQEEAIGASAAAGRDVERIRQQNIEYHRFSDENAGALDRERTIEQLGRFLHGDAFINFLADERLADVCRRASRMLEDLTGGRYAIISKPDDGFLVRDMANGGAERSPNSLSGGETFIVSLSLALALSDTIQLGRAPLEFFFLDEGFGTLDADLLDTVVDTLERLRSRRRTIGLITHVGALRERIPRRLVVTAPTDIAGSIVTYDVA
jgi:DNA repair protein SbcC/Rad50